LDAELSTSQITWELINELAQFEPFGVGNPKPLFLLKNLRLCSIMPVGKDGKHVRVSVCGDAPCETWLIGFGLMGKLAGFGFGDEIDVVAEIGVNEWNGSKNIQVRMIDMRRSEICKYKTENITL
jgi:single-stranded-DNA-specific exonuclease